VFAAGTAVALALPPRIDSDEGEVPARISSAVEPDDDPRRWSIGPRVVLALRANVAVRAFAGFVTLYLAFRLRTDPLPGVSGTASVLLVVGLLGVGGGLGTGLGTVLRRLRPETLVLLVVVAATLAAAWATLAYGLVPVLAVALAAGTGQTLAKLGLDALVQQEVPEAVRTSAFARSETVLQLAWVLGGFTGLALPVPGPWGMGVATAVAGVAAVTGVAGAARTRSAARARRDPDEGPLLREADPRR
jgi:hypothetical protein